MEEKTWTLYCHTNKVNGKMYFGITCSNNPKRRWRGGSGYKACPYFSAAIEKYGWDGFKHEVIETGLTKDEASEAERLAISFFDTDKKEKGYNVQPGGISVGGMSDEGKASLRTNNIGLNANKQRPVVAFDLDGNKLGEFPLISFAAQHFGIKRGTLINHLRKPRGTCSGMIFKYAEDVVGLDRLPDEAIKQALYKKPISGCDSFSAKSVVVFDYDTGKRIAEFGTVNDASSFCGVDVQGVLSGRQKSCAKKYTCRYSSDVSGVDWLLPSECRPSNPIPNRHKEILQYTVGGDFVSEYISAAEASRATGISCKAIYACAGGDSKTSGGYVWKYK